MPELKKVVFPIKGEVEFSEPKIWEGQQKGYRVSVRVVASNGKPSILELSSDKDIKKGPFVGEVSFAVAYGTIVK